MKPTRILIADSSSTVNQHVKTFLEERNFQVFMANDGEEALGVIVSQKPRLALIELMLPKMNALTILKSLKSEGELDGENATKVAILSNKPNIQNIKECMRWGAIDFLLKPIEVEDMVSRIVFHLQPSRGEPKNTERNEVANLYLHLVELVLQQVGTELRLSDVLRKLTQMSAMSLKSVRTSVIKVEPQRVGVVKASSDDYRGTEWTLDLRKYPEILYAINTGKTLAIENLENDPTLNQIKQYFQEITFNSMIVVPIHLAPEKLYGVLVVRMPADRTQIFDEELRFAKILSQAIAIAIKFEQVRELSRAA
ncbi:MAG: hypothetical protein RJB66_291 [Pseudomonadota bacterium]